MSKLGEALRALKVYNTWGLLEQFGTRGSTDIGIGYHKYERHSVGGSKSVVFSPSHDTGQKSDFWADYRRKTFTGDRRESFPKAVEWALKQYPATEEFVPGPFGDHIPKSVLKAARKFLKEQGHV